MVRAFPVGVALALSSTAGAVRRVARKKLGGVSVLNYNDRFLQQEVEVFQQGAAVFDWVMKFKQGVTDEEIDTFCSNAQCTVRGHATGVAFATVRGSEEAMEVKLNGQAALVDWLEPDTPVDVEPIEMDSSAEAELYSHEKIGLATARYTGKDSHIYVMDTGIRASHLDFGGRAIPTVDTILGSGIPVDCAVSGASGCGDDDHGHGTHVAGTAGGTSYGVAPQATLHTMKVCCGAGTNILGGMDWLVQFAVKPAVMTMSLGSYTMPESSRIAVDAVVAAGITVTVSAGNRNSDSCMKSYTFISSAIGVAASDETNTRASFSNWGACNAIFAPGARITSASNYGDDESRIMSGTSMAAPAVAGATALLLEENPTWVSEDIRGELQRRGKKGVIKYPKDQDPNILLWVGQ